MLQNGSHLAQANLSQGFKRYCAWASATNRNAPSFADYRAREDVQAAYAEVAEVSELDALKARIAELEAAQTVAPVKPARKTRARKTLAVGSVFEYTRTDGSKTQREVLEITDEGLKVRNLEHNVVSKRIWRGIDRQLAKKGAGSSRLI